MSTLDRILERMPDEAHRESFLRLVNEAGLKDDSLDLLHLALIQEVSYGVVDAMTAQRERTEEIYAEAPTTFSTLADMLAELLVPHLNTDGEAIETHVRIAIAEHDRSVADRLARFGLAAESAIVKLDHAATTADQSARALATAHERITHTTGIGRATAAMLLLVALLIGGIGGWSAGRHGLPYHHVAVAAAHTHRR